jgi:hypothetical protein
MIKPEFIINGLQFSKVLDDEYSLKKLEESNFKFEDGWRLPNRWELTMLYDEIVESRSTDHTYLWSVTAKDKYNLNAWLMDFFNGSSTYFDRTRHASLRLVREVNSMESIINVLDEVCESWRLGFSIHEDEDIYDKADEILTTYKRLRS